MSIKLTRFFVIDKPSINGNGYVNRINDSKKELALRNNIKLSSPLSTIYLEFHSMPLDSAFKKQFLVT